MNTILQRSTELGLPSPESYAALSHADAEAHQARLAVEVSEMPEPLGHRIAGGDTAFDEATGEMFAAVVVVDDRDMSVIEIARAQGTVDYGYAPGLLSFREVPLLCKAIASLNTPFDALLCDGHGRIHPRRCGLACHLGLLLDRPAIGVGKTHFIGSCDQPETKRGNWSEVVDGTEVIGRLLRTQDGVRPVYVSIGHRVDLEVVTMTVLRLASKFRQPEPTRLADIEVNEMRRLRFSP